MHTLATKYPRWLMALALAAALSEVVPVFAQPAGSSSVSATLPAGGGWVAYSFSYPANGSQVGVTLTYSPADGFTSSKGAVTLDAYSPNAPPPGGPPIGSATPSGSGTKYWQLGSAVGGDYILVVHNWDPLQRRVAINLRTTAVSTGAAGPALGPVFSSAGAVAPTIFAAGLLNPRGLSFGPDGNLYVAEGGMGGTLSTVGHCTQVSAPVGPYTGGLSARISKITPAGVRSTVVDHLPSSQTSPALGNLVSGVADVQFIGGTLYGLEAGAGCSHGLAGTDNTLFRVNPDGTTTTVADLSAFLKTHPVAHPDADDFEPDGTWYGMVAVGGAFYANEPNHQELDRITLGGGIARVLDLSTLFVPPGNWQGPTGIATYQGNFYAGTLGTFPVRPGTQSVYQITPGGSIKAVASGLTAVLGVAFDAQGHLYALETDTVAGFPGPGAAGTGQVVCVNGHGTLTTVATGLTFPTGMTFGPDGNLYVSNIGFGAPPGAGQIVRINTSAMVCT